MTSWERLQSWTRGQPIRVERVRLLEDDVVLEGSFELPPLACLSLEEQVFAAAFIRAHGSLKQMEESFGISYPTIKNRLRGLSERLGFLDVDVQQREAPSGPQPPASRVARLLEALEAGELDVKEVLGRLASPPDTAASAPLPESKL